MESRKVEHFIELVRKNDILYNLRNKEYKNMKKKMIIWAKIADEMELSVDACKKKWKSLRDAFGRQNAKRPTSGQAAEEVTERWQFFQQLLFLKEHIKPRNSILSYDCHDIDKPIAAEFVEAVFTPEAEGAETELAPEAEGDETTASSADVFCPSSNSTISFLRSRKRKAVSNMEAELIKTMGSIKQFLAAHQQDDEDALFCASITKKLKRFPLKEKNKLKVQIMQLVSNMEEELFEE